MKILIKNGRVDRSRVGDRRRLDILIDGDRIAEIDAGITLADDHGHHRRRRDAWSFPGLIDMHVHFREPGREDVETIIGGSSVAAKGGFTSVCTMPNTNPVIDNQALVRFIKLEAENGPINVLSHRHHHQGRRRARRSPRWGSSSAAAPWPSPTTAGPS